MTLPVFELFPWKVFNCWTWIWKCWKFEEICSILILSNLKTCHLPIKNLCGMTRWPSLISFHSLERIRTIFLSRSNYNFVTDKSSEITHAIPSGKGWILQHPYILDFLTAHRLLVALSNLIFKVPRTLFAIDVLSGEYKIHVDWECALSRDLIAFMPNHAREVKELTLGYHNKVQLKDTLEFWVVKMIKR